MISQGQRHNCGISEPPLFPWFLSQKKKKIVFLAAPLWLCLKIADTFGVTYDELKTPTPSCCQLSTVLALFFFPSRISFFQELGIML